jgi:hypothetical protein
MKKVLTIVAGAMLLAACTSTGGEGATESSGSASPSVQSASPGEAAGKYVDNKSRCTAKWNFDTTANVQLKNAVQRIGITGSWDQEKDQVMYLKQKEKYWANGGGLADEGEWKCKAVPWAISNDRSRVYGYNGDEWKESGDNDFYWGHTQDVSGATSEPNGWVKFECTGTPGGETRDCPESALNTFVQVNWDAENDDWTKLEKSPSCGFSATSPVGCWETGKAGGQYEGQFNFNATAWTAPMRVQLVTTAKDDSTIPRPIVWEITKAETQDAIWPNLTSPESALLVPGKPLYIGAYAMASNGVHGFTLTLSPVATVDDSGQVRRDVPPRLANKPIVTISVGINLSGVDAQTGPPRVEVRATKDICTVNPRSSGSRTFSCDVESAGTPFTYGGAWSATIKTAN